MSVVDANSEVSLVAARVAPEDLRAGDYVAILSMIREYPSFFWCGDSDLTTREEPVRVLFRDYQSGTPLKVKAICLPFVFVKQPDGTSRSLDVRQVQLVRLSDDYANTVWKELK